MKNPLLGTKANRFIDLLIRLRNRHFMLLDLATFCVTPAIALLIRLDDWSTFPGFLDALVVYSCLAIIVRIALYIPFGLYSRYWRYASIDEVALIAGASLLSTVVIAFTWFGLMRPLMPLAGSFPRSIPFLDGILAFIAVGGIRYSVRYAERIRQHSLNRSGEGKRVVVFGAGNAGSMIVREMQANSRLGLTPVAFLDNDHRKHGTWIYGVLVVGNRDRLAEVVKDYRVEQAIIAMPSTTAKTIAELVQLCREVNLPVKTVPGISELLDGSVTMSKLRDVEVGDLLLRPPVVTDTEPVTALLKDKRVLITGAGGSIGGELCRQIARCNPGVMILLGHGENSLFNISNELVRAYPELMIRTVVADIRDRDRLKSVFERHQPNTVFHAAAHKHVPMMEDNVEDAITNNIMGTRILIDCSLQGKVEHFVLISTDKAVNPTSVMGATKRVAEYLVHDAAVRTGRCFVAVRFGNVLGSRGSVVPFFKEQIARGGPVTVTHPEIRRYFMTIPEAVQLVLQAATLGKGAEVFVLDMGEPIKIVDMARELIRLSGLKEGKDINIEFTGLRPGEKLFEELFLSEEKYAPTKHAKIFVSRNGVRIASPVQQVVGTDSAAPDTSLGDQVDALIAAARSGDSRLARQRLGELVPEYLCAPS